MSLRRSLVPPLALAAALAGAGLVATGPTTQAAGPASATQPVAPEKAAKQRFYRTATYPVFENVPSGVDPADETVAEISSVTEDGNTVVYTDAAGKRVGFVDITDPAKPKGTGTIDLAQAGDADDQPTSVAVHGDQLLVVVDTSGGDYEEPSGRLDIYRIDDRELVRSIDLGGQPDSIAISSDGSVGAVAMENQRDEEATPAGGDEGDLPQAPPGFVQVLDLEGDPEQWTATAVPLTEDDGTPLPELEDAGLDTPEDPEPEYVSINADNQLALTLQENNGVVLIDLETQEITGAFSTGSVNAHGFDLTEDGTYSPTERLTAVREPDAIGWLDTRYVATANEGDWKGGSRSWTVFDTTTGQRVDETFLDGLAATYGLHNEERAEKKGAEPEGLAVSEIGGKQRTFVGSERSNFVAVYDTTRPRRPRFEQLLPTTNGPEGLLPIPKRNLFVISSETDEAKVGVRSAISIYRYGTPPAAKPGQPGVAFPSVVWGNAHPRIGWGALSALASDPRNGEITYAASDSAFSTARIYTLYRSGAKGAFRINDVLEVRDKSGAKPALDVEGLAYRPGGGFWLANEGATGADNYLLAVSDKGRIESRVSLPKRVTGHVGKWGLEGVTSWGRGKDETLYVALQRPLFTDPADPTAGTEDGTDVVRIGRYRVATKSWEWFGYRLQKTTTPGDWLGLSEIVAVDGDTLAVLERDKQAGPSAKVKRIYSVDVPLTRSTKLRMVKKRLAADLLPALRSTGGWTQEKVEGMTVDRAGRVRVVTDNDGTVDATGETVMWEVGRAKAVFGDRLKTTLSVKSDRRVSTNGKLTATFRVSPDAEGGSVSIVYPSPCCGPLVSGTIRNGFARVSARHHLPPGRYRVYGSYAGTPRHERSRTKSFTLVVTR